ncbi:hypothetical protein ABB30_14955 [Stenotrophomonas ginsengisoli]|uniref:Uncharacterized protein n=1 Tax=Stenotrophomonas ginsengisoli TaxID=336566 RepID=A0A0R0CXG1_9GAMM|nr:hypothetical protein [Stenotrophomonas ginsengisoli]KRG73947.1 hypothetical protein ABB30_14955 [Stenotrophomonas ginsengisoli]
MSRPCRRPWLAAISLALCLGAGPQALANEQVQVQLPPDAALAGLLKEESLFIFPLMSLVANNCPDTGLQPGDSHLLAATGQRIVELMAVSDHLQRVLYLESALREIQQADVCTRFAGSLTPVVTELRRLGATTEMVE